MSEELKDLFEIVEDFKADVTNTIVELRKTMTTTKDLTDKIDAQEKRIEYLKQLVAEYKNFKEPLAMEAIMKELQKTGSIHANKIQDIISRLSAFEVKQWLRILSDEEIRSQYELAGKPSMSTIAKHFNTTPENAFNYAHCKVKDAKIRWEFYRFCGGA
jgi:predicted unusual protein kinase regulating ubiquinone biosynthesis (AarF/ABC1/UbiB family)